MGTRRLRRHRLTALAASAALAAALAAPASAVSGGTAAVPTAVTTQAYCGITWGSLAKANAVSHTTGTLTNVRSGRHACFDRLVLDVANVPRSLSYDVRYGTVRQEGSGAVVPLKGDADLRIVLRAPAYDSQGRATYTPRSRTNLVDVTGYSTFRQVAWAGSFEGQTTIGLGVRARLPMRVFVLDGPGTGARLVIDVAHRW